MDNSVLRKRLSTFKSAQGHLRTISDDVIFDVLRAWEHWPGTTADLYRDLGIKKGQLSSIIRRAKKLVKEGAIVESEFKQIEVEETGLTNDCPPQGGCIIELVWNDNVIRFGNSDLLLDFLKKAA
jgi:hypothetical protein